MPSTPQMALIGGSFLPIHHNVNDSIARILCGLSYFIIDKAIQKFLSWALTFIHKNTSHNPFVFYRYTWQTVTNLV